MSNDIYSLVESHSAQLEELLEGSGLTLKRFKAQVFTLLERDWRLKRALQDRRVHPDAVLSAIMQVADAGLELTPSLQHAHLVMFENEEDDKSRIQVVPIIGYRGYIYRAIRCGAAQDIRPGLRRQGELFKYRPLHPTEPIVHEPLAVVDENSDEQDFPDAPDSNEKVLGAYAVAYLPNGLVKALYMSEREILEIANRYSTAYKAGQKDPRKRNSPWYTRPGEQYKKTVVRQLCDKGLRAIGDDRFRTMLDVSRQIEQALPSNAGELTEAETPRARVKLEHDSPRAAEARHTGEGGLATAPDNVDAERQEVAVEEEATLGNAGGTPVADVDYPTAEQVRQAFVNSPFTPAQKFARIEGAVPDFKSKGYAKLDGPERKAVVDALK